MVVIHEYLLLLSAPACRSLHLMKINNILYSFRIRTKFILMGTCIVEFLHKVFSYDHWGRACVAVSVTHYCYGILLIWRVSICIMVPLIKDSQTASLIKVWLIVVNYLHVLYSCIFGAPFPIGSCVWEWVIVFLLCDTTSSVNDVRFFCMSRRMKCSFLERHGSGCFVCGNITIIVRNKQLAATPIGNYYAFCKFLL
jgi:hypothetical protein